ncbi:hypothetical protein MCESTEE72_00048 [Candidatus Methylopumilus universalis]
MGKTRRSSRLDRNLSLKSIFVNYSWQKFVAIQFIVEPMQIISLKSQ